jgi:hypothetical protein
MDACGVLAPHPENKAVLFIGAVLPCLWPVRPLPAYPVVCGSQRSTRSMPLTAFPSLTTEAVAEALGVLTAHDADPSIFAEALERRSSIP